MTTAMHALVSRHAKHPIHPWIGNLDEPSFFHDLLAQKIVDSLTAGVGSK